MSVSLFIARWPARSLHTRWPARSLHTRLPARGDHRERLRSSRPKGRGAPKSQQSPRISRFALCGQLLSFAQKLEELDTFARPAPEHVPTREHLADDRHDLAGAEIEPLVENLERIENF